MEDESENRGVEEITREDIVSREKRGPLRLCGGIGSPYSNKMLYLLRFRRIPFRWIHMHSPEERGTEHAKGPVLLPKILWPDGRAMNDSTFLAKRLEREYPGRSAEPATNGVSFLCNLVEDFADEWLTKCMYHFRWVRDPVYASEGIAMHRRPHQGVEEVREFSRFVRDRQVSRLSVVGSNRHTGPVIEAFLVEFVGILDAHLKSGWPFLFGSRPSIADFAILGQIHPMIALDPKTSAFFRSLSSRVVAWYHYCTDLSGLSILNEDKGWIDDTNGEIGDTLRELFKLMGRFYVPFMIANHDAYLRGEKTVSCTLDRGQVQWSQPTFKYQSKCLIWIRAAYLKLLPRERSFVERATRGTGLLGLLSDERVSPSRL